MTESRKTRAIATQYNICVKRSGVIIGHLLRKLYLVCTLFLRRGGIIIIMYSDWRTQVFRRSTLWESEPFGSGSTKVQTPA